MWYEFTLKRQYTQKEIICQLPAIKKVHQPGWGYWPRKWVWGCAALKTPYSRLSWSSKGPISSKRVSSQDPLLRKFWNFSLYSLNFCQNFSSQVPKFGNCQLTSPQVWKFSVHKLPNLEIFSSQAPKFGNFSKSPLSEASISSQAPHFGNLVCTPLPEKKVECLPRDTNSSMCDSIIAWRADPPFNILATTRLSFLRWTITQVQCPIHHSAHQVLTAWRESERDVLNHLQICSTDMTYLIPA